MMNTKEFGNARVIIFKNSQLFEAVCLDFDIIEEAETREEAEQQIKEAIIGYIENICKNNLDDNLLNRHAEKKYWDMYNRHLELIKEKNDKKKPSAADKKEIRNTSMFTMPITSECVAR